MALSKKIATTPLSDEQLVLRFQKTHHQQWLKELFLRYSELIYGVCLKYLGNESDAQDAYMQVYEKLVKKIPSQSIQTFRPWLYVLVKNHCLMQLRRQSRNLTVSLEDSFMQLAAPLHPLEEEELQQKEIALRQLNDCINTLKPLQKSCVELFYLEGKTYQEIAALRQLPLGKVRSHIQNGRRNLKNCMEKTSETSKND